VTRQRRWQLRKIAEGKCSICGNKPLDTGDRCEECADVDLVRRDGRRKPKPLDKEVSDA